MNFCLLSFRVLSCLILMTGFAAATPTKPYPGVIEITVDATDIDHGIFNVKEIMPVAPGPITLWLPKWLPGTHADEGEIKQLAGLVVMGNGKRIEWKRDPLDMFAFNLEVPTNVKELAITYQSMATTEPGRAFMTRTMLIVDWIAMALYPAGYDASQLSFKAALKVPTGWKPFSALDLESRSLDLYRYKIIDFENLVDSPVYAGKYYQTVDLDPGSKVPVRMNLVAEDPRFLVAKPEHIEQHRNLVKQALKLFGSHHYDHYDFLFSLSDQLIDNGLEHHRSSEDGLATGYFTDWDPKVGSYDLLAHEFTHSWNGKFRRPKDLYTPNYTEPMQDSLLWVYEGQTEYWGHVLSARSGIWPLDVAKDELAIIAATYTENCPGLSWRALQDTTNDEIILHRLSQPYVSWQLSHDYYRAGLLIWLEADTWLRAKSNGTKSLDDFAKAFFGVDDGDWGVKTYTFEDVVSTLNAIVPDDWASFLRTRLDGHGSLTGGIAASGWRLVFKDTPNPAQKSHNVEDKVNDYTYSLGFTLDKDGKFASVLWDGPAFRAGVGKGMTLVAVGDRQYNKDYLEDAIKAAQKGKTPIKLLIKSFDVYRTVTIDYKGGLRYPYLERVEGTPDYLTAIYSPRT